MTVTVLVPPVQEPVSLQEVYAQLRFPPNLVTHPDDARLKRLIRSARERVETWTRRALCLQTLQLTLDGIGDHVEQTYGTGPRLVWQNNWGLNNWIAPSAELVLRPPVQQVLAIQYYDTANALRSIDVAQYRVNLSSMTTPVEFVQGFTFPQVFDRGDAVSVVYTAGYTPGVFADDSATPGAPDYAANVPETIKYCLLLMVEQAYDSMLPAEDAVIDDRIESALATYRVWRF